MNLPIRLLAGAAPALSSTWLSLLTSCVVVGTDHTPPEPALAPAWREQRTAGLADGGEELARWWTKLGDPMLASLVERSISGSLELREALLRIEEARALRGVARADLYPALSGRASYERQSPSDNTPNGAFIPSSSFYTAALDASWEIDLWGRVRRSIEAAGAELEGSIEEARAVAVSISAETALAYVELRAFQRRLDIARTNLSLQEQTLALVRTRFEAGLVTERDVAQASTNVETTRSFLPELEIGLRVSENRLAVLLGLSPGALGEELAAALPIPRPPLSIAVGVPADLLRRRADLRRAERLLAAEVARVGVAEGDLLPRLAVLGSLGLSTTNSGTLFEDDSAFYSIGPSLRWSLFEGGRLKNRLRAQEARAEQALVAWERTLLTALEEAENAMTSFVRGQDRRTALEAAATQAKLAVELAKTQYEEGLSDFQTVLDSERALAALEDELARSDAGITLSAIALYRALGGGFEKGPIHDRILEVATED
jgi:multidrug efflux system outer membrane protein